MPLNAKIHCRATRNMRRCVSLLLLVATLPACQHVKEQSMKRLPYPVTEKVEQVDDYHGTKVAAPYRWLEDDNAPARKAWVEAHNKVAFGYLEQIPERARIRARL